MIFKHQKEAILFANKNGIEKLEWLGEGDNGSAFGTKCGKIIKITKDKDEFICAYNLLNLKNEHLADIYSVEILENDIMCILMERLDTKGVKELYGALMNEAEYQNCHYSEINKKKLYYQLNNESFDLAESLMKAKLYAASKQIELDDIHGNNIGKKSNGNFALFDQRTGLSNKRINERFIMIKNELENKNSERKIKNKF